MSGASDALATLQAAISAPMGIVARSVADARTAQAQFRGADNVLVGMGDAALLILALEKLAADAKTAEKAARVALATVMSETGATSIKAGLHTATVSDGRQSVEIVDAAAVPPELMTAPQPAPDKNKIGAFLKGKTVNWARFVPGAPILTIRNSET